MAGTIVASVINNDTGLFSTNNAYLGVAKAWVNINTSGSTGSIRASFNVSSVTYNGIGDYTINFATALTDANYVPTGIGQEIAGPQLATVFISRTGSPSTTALRISVLNQSGNSSINSAYVCVAVFGN